MELLAITASAVAVFAVLYSVLVLPFRVRFVRELRKKSRSELEAMAFRYEHDYFGFIGHDHPQVVSLKQLIAERDVQHLRREWRRLSSAFVRLERKAGHTGRPLIVDYYHWHELVLKELSAAHDKQLEGTVLRRSGRTAGAPFQLTASGVLSLLDAERDERGMSNWEKLGSGTAGMKSFGIGLTRLRKLAKRIGRNRELAHALWKTNVYEARVIALLVDDPAQITRDQAEKQVEQLAGGMLAHVFASCDATLAKTSFVVDLADQWARGDDPVRRECGYGLLYEVSKFSGRKAPSEQFFLAHVARIVDTIGTESEKVRLAMGAALMGIGKRSAKLNKAALKVARAVGPIEFSSASGECEPFDVVKHLTSERLKEKLGV